MPTVDQLELVGPDRCHPTKDCLVRQLVLELVHGDTHVPRLVRAAGKRHTFLAVLHYYVAPVQVAVILGQEVHVVEDEAVPGAVLARLHRAHVQQLPAVERVRVRLLSKTSFQ